MGVLRKKKWWLFFVTTSGTSLMFLDNTVMPVALPTIQKELSLDPVELVWVVNAYLLSLTALLLIGGRLSDLFGKKLLFIWGLFLFGIGSLLAALSHNSWLLLGGRVVQGAGGALTIPTTGALLFSAFAEGERAKALGINTGISGIFLILGPAVGGFLTQYVGWRSIFYLNLPIVVFGIFMSLIILKQEKRKNETFHFTGAFAMLFGVTSLVIGLMQANDWGWSSLWTLTLLCSSPFFFALFGWISTHTKHPIIDFHFFRNPLFTAANLSLFVSQVIVMVTVLWAIYFQEELHYTPAKTGLLIFLAAFPVFFMAPLGGFFADRFGCRTPLLFGYGIMIFALFWLLFTISSQNVWMLLPGLLGFGFGLPLIMSPTVALALSQADSEKLGSASGISTEVRQLASTTGIAMMTAVYLGTTTRTGSSMLGFSAISILAAFFAILGFCVVFFMVKSECYRPASLR